MSLRDLLLPRPPFRRPRRTVRLRLTIVYTGLFLAAGAVLLATTYVLVRAATGDVLVGKRANGTSFALSDEKAKGAAPAGKRPVVQSSGRAPGGQKLTPKQLQAQLRRDRALAKRQHDAELRQLLEKSGIALGLMAALSILLGWVAAGRVLRPLRTLNERAREISASDLHKRLALAGPDDELKQLAGTFDDLLDRLEASFAAQRQFVANASHELRTPLARAQTLAEVAVGDPDATVDSLRASYGRVLTAIREQERLIAALLTLARSERGLDHCERVDLAATAAGVVGTRRSEVERRGLELRTRLGPAESSGDPRLVRQLVANLIDNAMRHNEPRGWCEVTTMTRGDRAILSVTNSGPVLPPTEIGRLFQPFQRIGADRTGEGIGLGLSIVRAIATAHGASLDAQARAEGGLCIEASFLAAGEAEATSRSAERTDPGAPALREVPA